MRLIRGIPIHRINPGARINHANRSDSPAPSAGDGHARRDDNSRHVGISGNRLFGGTRDQPRRGLGGGPGARVRRRTRGAG